MTIEVLIEISFWQQIDKADTWLFLLINRTFTNRFFDAILPWWRESTTWLPLYLFLLVFMLQNFGKKSWSWILLFVFTVAVTDQISSNLIKNLVMRLRPCQNPFLMSKARLLLDHCSGGYSFTSSHAANHFGMATFIYFSLKSLLGLERYLIFAWAASVVYAQVYVGVHYPLDILGGAFIGIMIGFIISSFFKKTNPYFFN